MCYRLGRAQEELRRPVSIQDNSSRPKDLSAALWQAEPERDRLQRLCRLPAATTGGTQLVAKGVFGMRRREFIAHTE